LQVHQKDAQTTTCVSCGVVVFLRNMGIHWTYHHSRVKKGRQGNNKKPFPAPESAQRRRPFSTVKNKPKPNNNFFRCHHCEVSFNCMSNLSRHLLTHAGMLEDHSNTCLIQFPKIKYLKLCSILYGTGKRAFKCSLCETPFHRRDTLIVHLRKVHKQSDEDSKEIAKTVAEAVQDEVKSIKSEHQYKDQLVRPFPCSLCEKAFSTRTIRDSHLRLAHTGTFQFQHHLITFCQNPYFHLSFTFLKLK